MRKKIFTLVIMIISLLFAAPEVFAQRYPNRPITLVIPMAPGDGLDIAGRLMGEKLSELLKVPIIPLNKPGATATVGLTSWSRPKKMDTPFS